MYSIQLTKTAKKALTTLDKRYQRTVAKALDRLSKNPHLGMPLVGKLKGLRKLRFSRYRIIYTIHNNQLIVIILDIRHRKDVYRL